MSDWYDKQGNKLATVDILKDKKQWRAWIKDISLVEELLRDRDYRVVKQEYLWWGGWLSTVWLGLDHRYSGSGKPVIFETMLFYKNFSEIDMRRYTTERQAKLGHALLKREWTSLYKIGAIISVIFGYYKSRVFGR